MSSLENELAEYAVEAAFQPDWRSTVRHIDTSKHHKQRAFIESDAKFKCIRAGRRGGKTTGIAEVAVRYFVAGLRVLYTTPTQEQVDAFWHQVKWALEAPIASGALYKNETLHIIEVWGTKNRIRAKTAWDADSLRGDYGDLLIFDEYQLTNEDAWERVGAPMLVDNDGDAVFIYTPPSLASKFRTKARDPRHAAKLFAAASQDTAGEWDTFHFTSLDNPHTSPAGLERLTRTMTNLAYQQEILAEDKDEAPGALWTRPILEQCRVNSFPTLVRVAVGVDPSGGVNEIGIVAAGLGEDGHGYVLDDASLQASPEKWANAAIAAYHRHFADIVVGEKNFGGEMVESTLRSAEGGDKISYHDVNASRGKAQRAQPIAAFFERGRAHLVGEFPHLEDELCSWVPGQTNYSPNRLDAMVWSLTELMLDGPGEMVIGDAPQELQDYFGGFGG